VFGLYAFLFFVLFTPAGWQDGESKGKVLFYQNGMMHVGAVCVVFLLFMLFGLPIL
jgi:hypothetical protein